MVKKVFLLLFLTCAIAMHSASYRILYKEQLYTRYHQHLEQYPLRINENIFSMEAALNADFANPLYALAPIKTVEEWERYRNLFNMHIYLLLTQLYLQLGSKYMKYTVYFYNYPWQQENIESLMHAERIMEGARYYWEQAQRLSADAWENRFISITGIEYWADQNFRIENELLDYGAIIDRHIARIVANRAQFEQMTADTY